MDDTHKSSYSECVSKIGTWGSASSAAWATNSKFLGFEMGLNWWVWQRKKHGDAKFCDSWTLHLSFSDYLKDSLACSLGWNLGYNPRYEHTMADEDVMRYSKRNLDPMPKNVSLCAIKAACRQVIRKKMLNLLNKWETGQVSIQHLMPPDCIPKV